MKVKIAENIRTLRKERSLTQEQLAEALGVTVGAVYKWEAGLSTPEVRLIMELADMFEVSVDVLLGYEQQSGKPDACIERIEQSINEMNYEEAVSEAERALKKYPNYFDIVHLSALVYQLKFVRDKDEKAIERSNALFHHAIALLNQNKDERINEVTIRNHIAENYIMIEKTELALENLLKNNVCGINNSLIGYVYATMLKQPKEARTYLIGSFGNCLQNLIRTMIGLSNMYMELEEEAGIETIFWLIGVLDSIKENERTLAFTDKLKAGFMAKCAVWKATLGAFEEAREMIREAYILAKKFDDDPVYTLEGIKFFEGEEIQSIVYDDMGKTAREAVINIIFEEEKDTEGYQFIQRIWKELESESGK